MKIRVFIFFFLLINLFNANKVFSQAQACPTNFNFGLGNLTDWSAYTGNNKDGNGPNAILLNYVAPGGTNGVSSIPEYNLAGVAGISTNTSISIDPFGGFATIPSINGYQYTNSVTLGSTSISRGGGGISGGYIRGIKYLINVPTSAVTQPYTVTYAYAMVLENGSHATSQQPLFTATLNTSIGVIACASPQYNLPTLGNVNGGGSGATLDTAAARREGFTLSGVPSPNNNGNAGESGYRVYTKSWREVTMDLSPYRGQQVTLTFEADNCVPGGHFSYAYIALRNICAGLQITGDSAICSNTTKTYSVPELADATYNWLVPAGWTFTSDPNNPNIISVQPGVTGGQIIAHEKNSCADLYDTLNVVVYPPSIAGTLSGSARVCSGVNSQLLNLSGNTGSIVYWISSTNNGITWSKIANTTASYNANNLTSTTTYAALIQTNSICPLDTSSFAIIKVDNKSVGGIINPPNTNICSNQTSNSLLSLTGNVGSILNWQTSKNGGLTWQNFVPQKTDSLYWVNSNNTGAWLYRLIDKNGVCPSDTSSVAAITLIPTTFPNAPFFPADTSICFGTSALLNSTINIGTTYAWSGTQPYSGDSSSTISTTPLPTSINASPTSNTSYYLTITNTGCPNPLVDTFNVNVFPKINIFAGNDTNIVLGQPLVFQATVDSSVINFNWSPPIGLDSFNILHPTATIFDAMLNGNYYLPYILTGTNAIGCSASDTFVVRIFKTAPSIFIPNAFTPNGDGRNDLLMPILAGVQKLNYFRIYNRYGQVLFNTQTPGVGWDGYFKGVLQDTNTFVYVVEAIDYTGKIINQKGTFILIR